MPRVSSYIVKRTRKEFSRVLCPTNVSSTEQFSISLVSLVLTDIKKDENIFSHLRNNGPDTFANNCRVESNSNINHKVGFEEEMIGLLASINIVCNSTHILPLKFIQN